METKKTLALFGKPDIIVSDNGPQFIGKPYQDLMACWEIQHVTSSPRYPKSNGFIKRQVQTIKNTIKKCQRSGQDVQLALLQLRATPVCNNLPSPAEMLMNRKLATTLPSRTESAPEPQRQKLVERCEKMTRNYNRCAGTQLSPQHQEQPVWVMDHNTRKWKLATVIRIRDEPHSSVVVLDNGSTLRRNRVDLRTRAKSSTDPVDQSPSSSGRHGNGNFHHTQDYWPPSTISYLDRQGEITENQRQKETLQPMPQNPGQKENIQQTQQNLEHRHQQSGHQLQTTRSGRIVRVPKRYQNWDQTDHKDAHHKLKAVQVWV